MLKTFHWKQLWNTEPCRKFFYSYTVLCAVLRERGGKPHAGEDVRSSAGVACSEEQYLHIMESKYEVVLKFYTN